MNNSRYIAPLLWEKIKREFYEEMIKNLYVRILKFEWTIDECTKLGNNCYRISLNQSDKYIKTIFLAPKE